TLGVPISLLLLAGGVGLIFMHEWGRQVMLLYAGLALLMIAATAGAVLTLDLRTAEAAMMATTTQPSTLPSATTTQPVEATTRPEPTTQATPQPMAEPSV